MSSHVVVIGKKYVSIHVILSFMKFENEMGQLRICCFFSRFDVEEKNTLCIRTKWINFELFELNGERWDPGHLLHFVKGKGR